jgi:hypothetical protein
MFSSLLMSLNGIRSFSSSRSMSDWEIIRYCRMSAMRNSTRLRMVAASCSVLWSFLFVSNGATASRGRAASRAETIPAVNGKAPRLKSIFFISNSYDNKQLSLFQK